MKLIKWLKADDVSNDMGGAYLIAVIRIALVAVILLGILCGVLKSMGIIPFLK